MQQKEATWILSEKYNGQKTAEYSHDLERLAAGEPVDYIIGFREFLGIKIDLSLKPLIPRVETEYWVEQVLKEIKRARKEEGLQILDLFSGSGCIGLAVLSQISTATVIFGEKEKSALEQIRKNIELHSDIASNRARIVSTDIFDNINEKFDYIFANPPYISPLDSNVQKSVEHYEPAEALYAENHGLYYIEALIGSAHTYLRPRGKIFIEFGDTQEEAIKNTLQTLSPMLYDSFEIREDQFNRPRFLVLSAKD